MDRRAALSVPLYAYVRSSFTLEQSCSLQHTLFICTAHSLTITSSTLMAWRRRGDSSQDRLGDFGLGYSQDKVRHLPGLPLPLHSILFFLAYIIFVMKNPAYTSETRGGLTPQTSNGHVCRDIGSESAYVDIATTDGIFEHCERVIVTREDLAVHAIRWVQI